MTLDIFDSQLNDPNLTPRVHALEFEMATARSGQADLNTRLNNIVTEGGGGTNAIMWADYFNTTLAAGSVHLTATTPSAGGMTRTVYDTGNRISTSRNNGLVFSGGASNYTDTAVMYPALTRGGFSHVDFEIKFSTTLNQIGYVGLTTQATPTAVAGVFAGLFLNGSTGLAFLYDAMGTMHQLSPYTAGQEISVRIKPEAAGFSFWLRGDGFGEEWRGFGTLGTNANWTTLRPIVQSFNTAWTIRSAIVYHSEGGEGEEATTSQYDNDEFWGKRLMYQWRGQVAKINASTGVTQAHVAIFGDSWVAATAGQLRPYLRAMLGNAGFGFLAFGASEDYYQTTITRTGTWVNTDQTAGSYGVAIHHISSTTNGSTLSFPATFTDGAIHYMRQSGGGSFRYRVDGGAWSSTISTNAALAYTTVSTGLTGLSNASHTVEIEVVSGGSGVILTGFMARSAVYGAIVSNLGNGGLNTAQAVAVNATIWQAGLTAINPDAVIVLLGTNDAAANVAPATVTANLTTLVSRIRAALPNASIAFLSPAANGLTTTYTMSQYDTAMRDLASTLSCGYISGWRHMPPTYAVGNALGLYENTSHPNTAGYQLLANAVGEFLRQR